MGGWEDECITPKAEADGTVRAFSYLEQSQTLGTRAVNVLDRLVTLKDQIKMAVDPIESKISRETQVTKDMIKKYTTRGISKSKHAVVTEFPLEIRLRGTIQLMICALLKVGLYLAAFNPDYVNQIQEFADKMASAPLQKDNNLSEDTINNALGDLAGRKSYQEDGETISSEASLKYGGKDIPEAVKEFFDDCKEMQEKKRVKCVNHTLLLCEELREELRFVPTIFEPLVGTYSEKLRGFLQDNGGAFKKTMQTSFQNRREEENNFGPWLANANHIHRLLKMEEEELVRHEENLQSCDKYEVECSEFLWNIALEFRQELHEAFTGFQGVLDCLPQAEHFTKAYEIQKRVGSERISLKRMLRNGPRGNFLPERIYPGIGTEIVEILKGWTSGQPEEELQDTPEVQSFRSDVHKQCAASKYAAYNFWLGELREVQQALRELLQGVRTEEDASHRNFLRVVSQLKMTD